MAFATDDLFVDPGEPWDGQPTKVAPSGGIEATGFIPGQPVSVEFLNYLLHELSEADDQRALEKALNWPNLYTDDQTGLGTATPYLARATWDQRPLYYVTNGTTIQISYDNGQTWATDDTLASAVYTGISAYEGPNGDESTSAICASMTLSGAGRVSMRGQTPTWNDQAIGSAASANAVVADQYEGYFWVVGSRTGGGAPGIWGVETNDGATGGTIITIHPTSGTYALVGVAASPTYKLAHRTGGAGLWRWLSSDTNATLVTAPGIGDVQDIQWNDHDGAFYLVHAQGGQPTIYKSETGATGSWTAVFPSGFTGTCSLGGGFTIGKVTGFVMAHTAAAASFILATDDGGITWHWIGDPTTAGHTIERVRKCGNGLVASGYGGASLASFAIGLRGGKPL